MRRRISKLRFALRRAGGVDIVITHAPPRGLGDREDPAHMGFEALRDLIDRWPPSYLLHGHVHLRYDHSLPREQVYGGTRIINASERFVLEIPDVPLKDPKNKGRLIWKTRRKSEGSVWGSDWNK